MNTRGMRSLQDSAGSGVVKGSVSVGERPGKRLGTCHFGEVMARGFHESQVQVENLFTSAIPE